MYGLVEIQRSLEGSGEKGIENAAHLEQQRDAAWRDMKAADDASKKNAIGTGAGLGLAVTGGNPLGAVAGAGVGYLTYKFL